LCGEFVPIALAASAVPMANGASQHSATLADGTQYPDFEKHLQTGSMSTLVCSRQLR